MNLEQMEYIVEVSNTGSFTKAAQNTHVTLSAISQSISLLEAELGITLFNRSRGQGALPTIEGKQIIKKAQEVLSKVYELKEEARGYCNTLSGELKIATIPGPMHLLVDVVSSFKTDYPHVNIEIFEKGPNEILQDLEHSRIDIGLIVLNDEVINRKEYVTFEKLWEGKMVVGVHPNSPLAHEKKIKPEQLVGQTLVLYDDKDLWEDTNTLISQYGKANILFTTNNTKAIQNAVKRGLAITVGLEYSFTDIADIVPIELDHSDVSPVYYGWVLHKGKHPSQASKRFIQRLQSEF
ncbi:LysR family transcriptional regulator [Paenibacillus sp. UMB4589-SE434]|uniref:LysR family transcriptional regulator n=1 Tax=Paenibacillus sp. UMB4589-SE434 TaxID=3046314 RepID=UPI00254F6485|nr:LysR family transcriptional regulator [Paenibacillus sp. UMB4589-SE434]MDK8181330.1 LysR family transcriptional regulator [Paenibacillus sp. UMB4589-SE434]